jgi:D-glycero-D-manno-heptose 1,7-bisphosphate phosphatase
MGAGTVRRAVFLDRDGVLNESVMRLGFASPPSTPSELRIDPEAAAALGALKAAGFLLIVVTNQPDVARGALTREAVEDVNRRLAEALPLDAFYVCWHDDADRCRCRKPLPGMLREAAERFGIDLHASFMVGDRWRDIDAGTAAGCHTVLLERGHREAAPSHPPEYSTVTLRDASDWILKYSRCISGHQTS